MTVLDSPMPSPVQGPQLDQPRSIDPGTAGSDRRFRWIATANGIGVLALTGSIGVLLGISAVPAIRDYGGWKFFTTSNFLPETNSFGIAASMVGTVVIALIALVIAFPLALATALFITEYAPPRVRTLLVGLVDLMAAVPSLIFGIWGLKALDPHALYVDRWFAQWLGWIPIFHVPTASPTSVPFEGATATQFSQSPFIAGLVVALMVVPLASSVMRNVFSQAPVSEREAALALGSTRWGMIRTVVLPFGKGGIIGGTMLGLGRALGETVAVALILSYSQHLHVRILENGGITISKLIADNFGEAVGSQRYVLLGAGFVLFIVTLTVNTLASIIVSRSRSGTGVDI